MPVADLNIDYVTEQRKLVKKFKHTVNVPYESGKYAYGEYAVTYVDAQWWCIDCVEQNCWDVDSHGGFYFKYEKDALMFILKWK